MKLNKEQAEAVESIEGPVLVIAGPGTGKTQLLSARVANILKNTDAKPNNILCLTFTNKAAINMKSRIIDLVGPVGAKVVASTFHSFAAEIMNLYPDFFWNAARLSVAPETVQLDIIENIVAQLPLDHPLALKFAGQYTLLKDIQQAINLTKEAGLTPEKLRAIINANLAYINELEPGLIDVLSQRLSAKGLHDFRAAVDQLPKQPIDEYIFPLTSLSTVIMQSLDKAIADDETTNKCSNTSKWKARWIQSVDGQKGMFRERDRNNWWLKLADIYEYYREALHHKGFYDYADMLVEVIAQLEQNPAMLADIQERFNYVLIDEFQDTTPAQLRLAHLTADHHSSEGKPNLMAVGDDDQTIFKFSGAELNNMLGFKRTYKTAKVIVLTSNYRSTHDVLNTAQKVISQAESRLVNTDKTLDKHLEAAAPPTVGEIRAVSYTSREMQLSQIARDIKKHYKTDNEIAVLARSHDGLIKISALLQRLGVPVRYEQASNILDHEIVNQTYLIARLVTAIQSGEREVINGLVHQIIRWPAWGIPPADLWLLATAKSGSSDWLRMLTENKNKKLRSMGEWFLELSVTSANQPLAVTIEQIIGLRELGGYTAPLKQYFMENRQADTNAYFHGLSAIQLLRSLVHEFATGDDPTIDDLVRFIEINKENGITVADESPFITGDHAVQLLTVHKAKGLEFDHVYIIDAIEDNWKPRNGGRKGPANLPLQPPGDDFDDYVRLLYVAVTRAKSSLTISSYHHDHSGRDIAPSTIVQGVLPISKDDERDTKKLIEVLEENLLWPSLSGGKEKEMLKARLETYSLSVTHLLNFLDVTRGGPQYFKERNLLRLPEVKTPPLSYGTAMHEALDKAQKMVNKGTLELEEIEKTFATTLRDEQLAPADYERYLGKGRLTLSRLFTDYGLELIEGSQSEQNLNNITIGAARIGGKLDRVDELNDKIVVTDYKTGTPLSSFNTTDSNKAIKVYKHRMQLIFYALMLTETGNKSPIEGQMIYVDAERKKELSLGYAPSPDDIEYLRRLILAVWPRIINLDLPDVSTYSQDIEGIRAFEADLLK